MIVPCSKASIQQRSGRAGRTSSGKVYRLFKKEKIKILKKKKKKKKKKKIF